jgi:prephenate dehydrogenase
MLNTQQLDSAAHGVHEAFGEALVLGLGVIGGSIAAGIKKRGLAKLVVGYSLPRDAAAALNASAVDVAISTEIELCEALKKADLVILALPVDLCISVLPLIEKHLPKTAVLTDVCSVKKTIAQAVEEHLGLKARQFIAAHPIAGSHLSGFEGARPELFEGAAVVIAPSKNVQAFEMICSLWRALGATIQFMSNESHDEHYANVSHLPHLVAFSLSNAVSELAGKQLGEGGGDVGKGFLDTTRIAASSPELWCGIAMANREALLKSLDEFLDQISTVRGDLARGDSKALTERFQSASDFRKRFD